MSDLRSSLIPPPLFPNYVVHEGSRISEDIAEQANIRLPVQLESAATKRKIEYICGRYHAREALRKLGIITEQIERAENGCPKWPIGVAGSITHSDDQVFVAVAKRVDVVSIGIDVEKINAIEEIDDIRPLFLSESEYGFLPKKNSEKNLFAMIVFSAKEAVFKCLDPIASAKFNFVDINITSLNLEAGIFTFSVPNSILDPVLRSSEMSGKLAISDGLIHTGSYIKNVF